LQVRGTSAASVIESIDDAPGASFCSIDMGDDVFNHR
jgi:hypothetical protein